MDHSEEMVAELDEPPDEMQHTYRTSYFWSPPNHQSNHMTAPPQFNRRESLLTRQLHSETEHTDDERHPPGRALSTQSTFSNPSTTSTAELTSDDGHSVASPAISPPLGPTHATNTLPIHEKPLDRRVRIVGQEGMPASEPKETGSEKTVEANLGRKRCITFACKNKQAEKKQEEPVTSPSPQKTESASPPKRKCMIKFACPTRTPSEEKAADKPARRAASPAPQLRKPSTEARAQAFRSHRGSDSTVTHSSPKSSRKSSVSRTSSIREDSQPRRPTVSRKWSNDSASDSNEATRFHEFGTSEDEPEDWTKESTCHRSRLTLDDVLKKENVIRKACEEAEEEVVEEEDEDEVDEELDEQDDENADVEVDENGYNEDDEDSDEGFHSDNEAGFASSDDESDSDYEWWKPGASTAATSVEHLDRLAIVNSKPVEHGQSSVGSASSGRESIKSLRHRLHKKHTKTPAMAISNRPPTPDLPDSTDFVCGTLDEDRPIEQAYINRKKMKEAAKHKARPQDIDPSFPTSDPEMDEEDDDDVDEVVESEQDGLMHGGLDEIHEVSLRRTSSNRNRGRSNSHRSPPPPKHFSPPPPKRRSVARSPPTPMNKRGTARSPPPRKLFGHSPQRMRSPAPGKRMMTSPPNSPTNEAAPLSTAPHLAERPRLQHTASLPRGGGFMLSQLGQHRASNPASASNNADEHDSDGTAVEIPRRSAIDIVKGLEKKRRLRKEKLYQKLCAKQAAKGERTTRVKPGKGCERMREVGLQLQDYRGAGKAEHILSL